MTPRDGEGDATNRKRRRYPSDVSTREWALVKAFLVRVGGPGKPATVDLREILDAIFYLSRTGIQWRMMPHDCPGWSTVYYYYRTWARDGAWRKINAALREQVRLGAGKVAEPSAAIIDRQSVKTTEAGGPSGFDAHKQGKGRQRHIMVDTLGLLLLVIVHSASIHDPSGAKLVFEAMKGRFLRLKLIWADGSYPGKLVDWVRGKLGWTLAIVRRDPGQKGLPVLPKRWSVERTFGWLGRSRRLSKDYEQAPRSSETMV